MQNLFEPKNDHELRYDAKRARMVEALVGFVTVFAQENIGENFTINYEAVLNYVEGAKFHFVETFDNHAEIEYCYSIIEEKALNGLPIWRFIKTDDRIIRILENTYQSEVKQAFNEDLKRFRCLSCKYFETQQTSIRNVFKCRKPDKNGIQNKDELGSRKPHKGSWDAWQIRNCNAYVTAANFIDILNELGVVFQ